MAINSQYYNTLTMTMTMKMTMKTILLNIKTVCSVYIIEL